MNGALHLLRVRVYLLPLLPQSMSIILYPFFILLDRLLYLFILLQCLPLSLPLHFLNLPLLLQKHQYLRPLCRFFSCLLSIMLLYHRNLVYT